MKRDLGGSRVFVSASFPSGRRGEAFRPYDAAAIAEAVTAVTHAVLLAGGRLVFGAHPTISPLVLLTAGELGRRDVVEIHQSRFFDGRVPQETLELVERGFGRLVWTDAVAGDGPGPSVEAMRETMLGGEPLAAGVFVGGMEGIFGEYQLLARRQPGAPRLPITAPGGAARQLRPSDDAIAARLAEVLGSARYPALARDIVAALADDD